MSDRPATLTEAVDDLKHAFGEAFHAEREWLIRHGWWLRYVCSFVLLAFAIYDAAIGATLSSLFLFCFVLWANLRPR